MIQVIILAFFIGVIVGAMCSDDHDDRKGTIILAILMIIGLALFSIGKAMT